MVGFPWLCTFKLKDGYYFVCATRRLPTQISQLKFHPHGYAWMELHPPVDLSEGGLHTIARCDPKSSTQDQEDEQVERMMVRYGIDKVRGGSHIQPNLERCHVERLLKGFGRGDDGTDLCRRCGRHGHEKVDCGEMMDIEGNRVLMSPMTNDKGVALLKHDADTTLSCDSSTAAMIQGGRNDSASKITEDEYDNDSEDDHDENMQGQDDGEQNCARFPICDAREKKIEEKWQEYETNLRNSLNILRQREERFEKKLRSVRQRVHLHTCFRCGRHGHFQDMCIAVTHVKGHTLDSNPCDNGQGKNIIDYDEGEAEI